ncbi:MAG: valine--tRNA ligase [Nevskiaceae bacterium]|nr:MAG: valine--tRNA ligase [Nevskiaceae bacterium]TBR74115.1 MAG: valine--tRNA ligase [Nevskiaceae bacterium]
MEKTFEPHAVETRWRDRWNALGAFAPQGSGAPYSIVIPPPNVTGTLHMGHAFQHTIMDALTRYHRMRGERTLWQPGTDHAGIATQMVVERNLKREGTSRSALGRDKFVEKVWEWKDHSHGIITSQIRRLGSSVDWSRERFTMDAGYEKAVIEHFVRLFDAGLIYRGKRLVNWDPVLQTAISDLEVSQEEENGHLWHLRYPLAGGASYVDENGQRQTWIVVATTRPETMLGDAAVAVHPEDERYRHLIGQSVLLPLCDREIPVIADEYVDRTFGTGAVKITPAHDFNDYAVGKRHDLSLTNIFTATATVNDNAPQAYRGLDRYAARDKIVAAFEAAGLLEKIEDHKLKVPRGDRSGAVLEPWLTDQWYVDLTRKQQDDGRPGGWTAITKPAIDAVESGRIRFVPDNWKTTYFHWLENIQDWCISRQLWWGHRIPAWYDDAGNVYVGRSEAEVREKARLGADAALRRDEDVFDTWFSSDIWPLATLGWPEQTPELKAFYPTSVLVTGFDIIFFWVARMVMMGLYFGHDVPFHDVFITGLVRDPEGNKMSKSKGNVLDPLDVADGITLEALLEKRTTGLMQPKMADKIAKKTKKDYPNGLSAVGIDALRFTFAAMATNGRDIRFDAGRAEGYRNFCNKLWNAARFVVMNCDGQDCGLDENAEIELGEAERWIISKLQRVEAEAAEQFSNYRFDLLSRALYEFVWNELCDWYLELAKPALATGTAAQQRGTRRTLARVMETALRLLHPLIPFVTEDLWQTIAPLAGRAGNTVMQAPYPVADARKIDVTAEADVEWLKAFILGVRQIRGEMNIAPGKILPIVLRNTNVTDEERATRLEDSITFLARVEAPQRLTHDAAEPPAATALLGEMKILVPMAGLIDKDAELARLAKLIAKIEGDLARNEARLASDKFVNGAPAAVVQKERDRVAAQRTELATLAAQQKRIEAL